MLSSRYSVYYTVGLLYWYQSTNTEGTGSSCGAVLWVLSSRYSVYYSVRLLYWYKSRNIEAADCADQIHMHPGTKISVLLEREYKY